MKKSFFLLCGILAAATVQAVEISRYVVSIGSNGPDAYADGAKVLPGTYAYRVVYVSEGAEFGGLYPDGSLVDAENNRFISFPQKALTANEDSGLDLLTFQFKDGDFDGGSFSLLLLDTRGPAGANVLGYSIKSLSVKQEGAPVARSVVANNGLVATTDTAKPEVTEAPVILNLDPATGELTMKNLVAGVPYAVQSADSVEDDAQWTTAPVKEWASKDKPSAKVDTSANTKFFRVKANPSVSEASAE